MRSCGFLHVIVRRPPCDRAASATLQRGVCHLMPSKPFRVKGEPTSASAASVLSFFIL